jgi:CBS domain-containing protein
MPYPLSDERRDEILGNREIVQGFCQQFREARAGALCDAEAFEEIIHVVERLGSFPTCRVGTLGDYGDALTEFVSSSAVDRFPLIYDLVRNARNDAMHQGAFASHLTGHAIELALILEYSLQEMLDDPKVCDYMVRNPVCAKMWQPIGFIWQQMLASSFSYLPVENLEGDWSLVSDLCIADFLRKSDAEANGERRRKDRKRRLATTLSEAINEKEIELINTVICLEDDSLLDAVRKLKESKVSLLVVCRNDGNQSVLAGIVTAFDLL